MGIKLAKFGGSSVAEASQLEKVKTIVEFDKDRRYVVVSAPGKRFSEDNKITDLLYLCKTHIDHNVPYDQVFQVVCDRFNGIVKDLGLNLSLQEYFDKIRENLVPGVSADYIASRGEYLSAIITAEYLGYDFVDAEGLIQFDENERFLYDETDIALRTELEKHEKAVLPGFYGTTPDGKIKTFSRGGSDITGSLVAKAIRADVYENWTDVSGFLMADPRIIENPKPIKVISYKELRELSYMGASVLHEDAIFPARQMNIPINIRNTNEPRHPGTIIMSDVDSDDSNIITGVAGKRDFIVIAIYKSMMNSEIGIIRRALSILENYGVSVEHIPSGIDTMSVVIAKKEVEGKLGDILDEFERKLSPDTMEVFEEMSLIATVGCGMAKRMGVAAKLFQALYDSGVNIRMIDQGSSEMNIIVGVENKEFEKSIKAIYNAFVNK